MHEVYYIENKFVYYELTRTVLMISWDIPGNDVVESAYIRVGVEITPVKNGSKIATPSIMDLVWNGLLRFMQKRIV